MHHTLSTISHTARDLYHKSKYEVFCDKQICCPKKSLQCNGYILLEFKFDLRPSPPLPVHRGSISEICQMCSLLFCFASNLLGKIVGAPLCSQSYHSLGLRRRLPPRPPPPPATHYYTDPLKNLPIFLLFHLDTLALTFYGTLEDPVQKAYWSKTPLLLPERDQQIILVFCQITVFSLLLGS